MNQSNKAGGWGGRGGREREDNTLLHKDKCLSTSRLITNLSLID